MSRVGIPDDNNGNNDSVTPRRTGHACVQCRSRQVRPDVHPNFPLSLFLATETRYLGHMENGRADMIGLGNNDVEDIRPIRLA